MHDFCYVSKKEAAPVKAELLDIIHEVQDIVRDDFTFQFTFIGSSSRNMIAVHGIRVFENDKGMFINMPSNSYTDAQGNKQYEDVFHPVTKEGRELLVKNVLDAYKQALEQAQTNSQTQSQTSGNQTMQQM